MLYCEKGQLQPSVQPHLLKEIDFAESSTFSVIELPGNQWNNIYYIYPRTKIDHKQNERILKVVIENLSE